MKQSFFYYDIICLHLLFLSQCQKYDRQYLFGIHRVNIDIYERFTGKSLCGRNKQRNKLCALELYLHLTTDDLYCPHHFHSHHEKQNIGHYEYEI